MTALMLPSFEVERKKGSCNFHDFVFLFLSAGEGQHEAEYSASDQVWESIGFCLFVSLPIVCCYRWFPLFHLVFLKMFCNSARSC